MSMVFQEQKRLEIQSLQHFSTSFIHFRREEVEKSECVFISEPDWGVCVCVCVWGASTHSVWRQVDVYVKKKKELYYLLLQEGKQISSLLPLLFNCRSCLNQLRFYDLKQNYTGNLHCFKWWAEVVAEKKDAVNGSQRHHLSFSLSVSMSLGNNVFLFFFFPNSYSLLYDIHPQSIKVNKLCCSTLVHLWKHQLDLWVTKTRYFNTE